MIAGVGFTNACFRLHPRAIKSPQIVAFLKARVAQIKRPLLITWDGLRARRSRMVRDFVDTLDGHIAMDFLPPYAPELNPVEYLWAWLKRLLRLATLAMPQPVTP
jgi:transposase